MHINQLFPSVYLKTSDLQGREYQVVMARMDCEDVERGSPPKPVVYFEGVAKGLVLNKTNFNQIHPAYGEETDQWIGRPVILFPTTTEFKGEMVPCIRLRIPVAPPHPRGDSGADAATAISQPVVNAPPVAPSQNPVATDTQPPPAAPVNGLGQVDPLGQNGAPPQGLGALS